jgi:hypothetical protein
VRHRLLPWIALLAIAMAYPLVVLAGGGAHFPTRTECIHPVKGGGDIEAVFGRFTTYAAAESLLQRAAHSGFENLRIESDGCGLQKVTLQGIPSVEVGRDFVTEANRVGFRPRLEQGGP